VAKWESVYWRLKILQTRSLIEIAALASLGGGLNWWTQHFNLSEEMECFE
jgi:hypothetical protein